MAIDAGEQVGLEGGGGGKGVGEGGAISPPAALANAIEDALSPFGVRITEGPVTPARIVALLRGARS